MKYSEARHLIKDGDIISFLRPKSKFSLFANTISFFTRSPIYHSAIAVWMNTQTGERRLFVVEADVPERRLVPLSIYEGQRMHVLALPDNVNFNTFSSSLIERVAVAKYNIGKAINAGLRKYLMLPKLDASGEICSEMCLKMWQQGGFYYQGETLITPDQLERRLVDVLGVKYRAIIDEI